MGFLRSKTNSPSTVPQFTGLQIQTSSNAVPITLLWGTTKVAPNVIWTGGFYSVPQYQKQGGKCGGGRQLQGYEYFSSFAMGVCEGPVNGGGGTSGGMGCLCPFGKVCVEQVGGPAVMGGAPPQIVCSTPLSLITALTVVCSSSPPWCCV